MHDLLINHKLKRKWIKIYYSLVITIYVIIGTIIIDRFIYGKRWCQTLAGISIFLFQNLYKDESDTVASVGFWFDARLRQTFASSHHSFSELSTDASLEDLEKCKKRKTKNLDLNYPKTVLIIFVLEHQLLQSVARHF